MDYATRTARFVSQQTSAEHNHLPSLNTMQQTFLSLCLQVNNRRCFGLLSDNMRISLDREAWHIARLVLVRIEMLSYYKIQACFYALHAKPKPKPKQIPKCAPNQEEALPHNGQIVARFLGSEQVRPSDQQNVFLAIKTSQDVVDNFSRCSCRLL
jgi:hypothetical protein